MMKTMEALMRGGKNGPVFFPGNPEKSHMIQRIHLPENDENHMPPKGKSQLTDEQVELLTWWVNEGAPFDKKVAQVKIEEKVQTILNTLVDRNANKTEVEVLLLASQVRSANEQTLNELRNRGVLVRPLATKVNWLQPKQMLKTGKKIQQWKKRIDLFS